MIRDYTGADASGSDAMAAGLSRNWLSAERHEPDELYEEREKRLRDAIHCGNRTGCRCCWAWPISHQIYRVLPPPPTMIGSLGKRRQGKTVSELAPDAYRASSDIIPARHTNC